MMQVVLSSEGHYVYFRPPLIDTLSAYPGCQLVCQLKR